VHSNVAVATIVLRRATSGRRAGFVDIPLDVRNPAALAVLGCIITATPGTAWAGYDERSNVVTIHVLDLEDDETVVRAIKDRYERPLREIFE
jgi:multicomponent K+:H+ antiporter subunit E